MKKLLFTSAMLVCISGIAAAQTAKGQQSPPKAEKSTKTGSQKANLQTVQTSGTASRPLPLRQVPVAAMSLHDAAAPAAGNKQN